MFNRKKYPKFKIHPETDTDVESMYIKLRDGKYGYTDSAYTEKIEPNHGIYVELDLDHEDNVLGIKIIVTPEDKDKNKDLI